MPWRAGPQRVCSHPVPTPRSSHPGLCTLRSLHPEQPLPCLWPSVSGYLLGRPCWPFRAAVVPTACFPGSAVSASLGNRPGLPMVGPLLSALQSPLSAGRHAPCMRAKSLRCVRLCHPMDCSPPGSSVHGSLQAGILERVAISFSRGSSQTRDQTHVSCVSCIGRQTLYH